LFDFLINLLVVKDESLLEEILTGFCLLLNLLPLAIKNSISNIIFNLSLNFIVLQIRTFKQDINMRYIPINWVGVAFAYLPINTLPNCGMTLYYIIFIICCRNFRNNASGNGRYDRHCEELHPAAVQVGKAIKCNDVAIFLWK
jgi:hypothetical protein